MSVSVSVWLSLSVYACFVCVRVSTGDFYHSPLITKYFSYVNTNGL